MASAWYLFFTTFVSEDLAFVYGLFSVIDNKMPALFFLLFYGAGVILGDLGLYLIGVAGRNEAILSAGPLRCLPPKIDYGNAGEMAVIRLLG